MNEEEGDETKSIASHKEMFNSETKSVFEQQQEFLERKAKFIEEGNGEMKNE